MTPRRSIILIYFREPAYLRDIVPALEREFLLPEETEIILVDNASGDGVAQEVCQQHRRLKLIPAPENLMYGKGANLGLQAARGEWMMIMNIDVRWEPGSLRAFTSAVEVDERIALAGPLVRYRDGRVQVTAHHRFPTWWTVFVDYCLPLQQWYMRTAHHPYQYSIAEHAHSRRVAHLTGVCLYIRRAAYEHVGGFDPAYSMYLEETDWQRRLMAAGQASWLVTAGSVVHFGSAEKTFAQASPQYLHGLILYASRWWRGPAIRVRLMILWWAAWVVSMLCLALAIVPTFFLPKIGRRVRHYIVAYLRLAKNLTRISSSPS